MSDSIAIIGGGLAGLTLSIGLTRHGIKHKIYESAAEFAEIGAGIAMGPNALTALTLLDPRVRKAYNKCATYNESEDQQDTWLTYRWGMQDTESSK
jgi:salicylate hydroxylase